MNEWGSHPIPGKEIPQKVGEDNTWGSYKLEQVHLQDVLNKPIITTKGKTYSTYTNENDF